MSAFSLIANALNARKPARDAESEIRELVFHDYVNAKREHSDAPTEATAKALYATKGALLSRLRAARGNRVDAIGCRFILHDNGGISVNRKLATKRDTAPFLLKSF